jgi:carboxybiotin decarboxylase
MIDKLFTMVNTTGFLFITPGMVFMWLIGLVLIFLAISKEYEPLLLPIGFGIILANLPLAGLMEPNEGLLWKFYEYGIHWEIIPPLIFLGLGALTDFGPMLARPSLIFLGAGAQTGVYITFFVAHLFLGFSFKEAATIGIIGGADGPTTIYLASHARNLRCGSLLLHGAGADHTASGHEMAHNRCGTKNKDAQVPKGRKT